MNRTLEMRDQKIGKLLWRFSLPAIIGMLVGSLYNIVDRIFVGHAVGFIGIAATTVAFPIMIILMATSMLIGIGATALISLRLGEEKQEEAEKIAGNATTLIILLPILLTIFYLLYTDPILRLFGAGADVLPYARDFTTIIMLGSFLGSIAFGMNNFIRAEGNPRVAMYTQILGGILNIILNYIFIMRLGFGIKGSALGSVISQAVSAAWVLGYFYTGRSIVKIKIKNLVPELPIVLKIVAIGFAPFSMHIANSVQQTIMNKTLIAYGGDMALAAIGIMMSVGAIIIMPLVGISQGAQPLIGYNYGAMQYDRVKETLKKAVLASTVLAVLGFLAVQIWPSEIAGLFSKGDQELTYMTSHAMLVFFALLPIVGFQIICSNYFQAVGKPVQSTILSLSRQVLFFIPLLLILPRFWGIDGAWRTAPISDALAVILTATFIYFEIRNLPKMKEK